MQTLSPGKHNPKLADLRKAIRAGSLTSDGLLPIEGPKLLDEAIRSGLEVTDVFNRHGVGVDSLPKRVVRYELDAATFKSIQSTETSQGVIALVRPRRFTLKDLVSVPRPRIVVLGRIQDPGNVGTIVRAAESFFATGCIALSGTADIYNPKTIRASAGSAFRLPHVWNAKLADVAKTLKSAGIRVVGTSPGAKRSLNEWSSRGVSVAMVIGNEGSGMNKAELAACDDVFRIPQNPAVESLNSAIAAAIFLFEASRHERLTI